ncbi:hypothetical protein DL765_002627 [Monosporascus sp. GIB2]|nr:hypothetical protein DL765_002627 [Monosporascus sp. GIB2]
MHSRRLAWGEAFSQITSFSLAPRQRHARKQQLEQKRWSFQEVKAGLSYDIIEGTDIDRPLNAITLTHRIHDLFGDFEIFFEPIDPPLLRLLAVHRAIAHILHLSAAGKYIGRLFRDADENGAPPLPVRQGHGNYLERLVVSPTSWLDIRNIGVAVTLIAMFLAAAGTMSTEKFAIAVADIELFLWMCGAVVLIVFGVTYQANPLTMELLATSNQKVHEMERVIEKQGQKQRETTASSQGQAQTQVQAQEKKNWESEAPQPT